MNMLVMRMKEDIILLKNEFKKIKNIGLVKSLRNGTTGIGYTFESLLNKKEDQECKPDFKSIELKCKLGYSKTPLSLFTCAPKRNAKEAINYIFNTYKFHRYNNKSDIKIFSAKLFSNYSTDINGYTFKLKVDYYNLRIIMQSFYNTIYLEDVCYWDFKTLEKKLKEKLTTLAIIYGYPYKINNQIYYKYLKMNIYKLRGFYEFLDLINRDAIFIYMYFKEGKDKEGNIKIENHGVCFKIRQENILKLFSRINY